MTNQTTNGKNESLKPIQELIAELDAKLEDYETQLGLPKMGPFTNENEVTKLFGMTTEDIRAMSRDEQAEAVVLLEDYQIYLQRVMNREQARIDWCNNFIDRVIAKRIMTYKGYSVDERRMQAIRDNDAATKAHEHLTNFRARLTRISFLPNRVDALARSLGFYLMRKNYGNFPT